MKLSTRNDIEAPIEVVFDRITDFSGFERQALRRGIHIERVDLLADKSIGMTWEAKASFRGKMREIHAELVEMEEPSWINILSKSGGVEAEFSIELLPLSRGRTRVKVGLQLTPRSLSARLLIQSMKFAKSNLTAKMESRVVQFSHDIEEKYDRKMGIRV